ncbi:hypothetical protein BCR36DRAFT_415613 [Piromyces finnis]|uniref:Uncharacterized protein n=1 Tax=Piromyces finnis TaxID=1754191 RepID=A0A1Y1UZY8_9FUNG|nr:hypothetical protein BCR36DRAFT_415613 [Piromyces finnis]|eukprot:ORX43430.1 hypothetical protein BCR36DRAFT_415613 [Piromyces finnis]
MGISVRRASADDVEEIYRLIKVDDYSLNKLKLKYGTSNISYLIDTSAISIVGINNDDHQIIGFISVSLSPYKNYLRNKDWTKELPVSFEIKDCHAHNTMFLSCCAYNSKFTVDFLFYSLKQIFLSIPNLKYIGYLLPKSQSIDEALCNNVPPRSYNGSNYYNNQNIYKNENTESFSAIQAMSATKQRFFFNKCRIAGNEEDITETVCPNNLWVCFRKDLVYIMKIRKARVEDCDDLIPMFKQKKLIDDPDSIYYFSELLENKDENVNTIVAEINNKIVGFMSMRSNIEYSEILDQFDLDIYETLLNDIIIVDVDDDVISDFSSANISNKSKKDSKSNIAKSVDTNSLENKNVEKKETEKVGGKKATIDQITKDQSNSQNLNISSKVKSSNNSFSKPEKNDIQYANNESQKSIENICLSTENFTESEPTKVTEIEENDNISESNESINDFKKIAYLNNAVCINLFFIDDYYASYSNAFLKAAFNIYPDKEYCLISLPTMELSIPLLEYMTRVDYREDSNIRHSLYLSHRESTLNDISVRKGVDGDVSQIEKLIENIPEYVTIIHNVKMAILSMENETEINEKSVLYVAECLGMIVGFAILKTYDSSNVLIEQFNIEKYCTKENHRFDKNDEFILSFIVMNPLYENKARYFLEEIMRQTEISCLIHTFNDVIDFSSHKIISKEFVPIKRRRQIQFVDNKRDKYEVAGHLDYNISLITTNLLYEPKITINTRIVVIGASDTGISFLETLIYKSHYLFNNLVLISDKEVFGSKECPYAVDQMNYSVHDLEKMNIENYIQFINNVVNVINREDKNVVIDTGEVIEYDYLIIATGMQFHPEILGKKFAELKGIYSGTEIETCIEYIGNIDINDISRDQLFIVYGNDIQAFPIIRALLENVPPDQIFFIVPNFDKKIRHWFDNRTLEKKVLTLLSSLGVNILLNYQIVSFDSQAFKLTDISLRSTKDEISEDINLHNVDSFFYVDKKSADSNIFNAINNSFLVFDGNLIIDSHFQTNDDFIFSAGSLTRYTSKYETLWNHSYYNSKECGKKLANTLLPIFEGNKDAIKNIKKENEALISFNDLVASRCLLPENMMYFHFDRPYIYNQTKSFRKTDKENYGRDLVINNFKDIRKKDKEIEYFHIHIDPYGFIQALTYVGKEDIFCENMICLYGMHEKYLNRLISRFDEGIIPDFNKFLNEPWAQPLFYDRFRSYMKRLRDDLMNPSPSSVPLLPIGQNDEENENADEKPMEMKEILDRLYQYVAKNEIVPEEERVKLYSSFDRSFDRKKIDYTIYRYLVESGFYNFP